jgi:flagellar protein FlgJ
MIRSTDTSSLLASDPNALARSMRASAKADQDGGIKAVAQQFEAIFLDLMVKNMRSAKLGDSLLDSPATGEFTRMMDQQLTSKLARTGGLGLADLLVSQLTQQRVVHSRPQSVPVAPVKNPAFMP